MSTYFGVVFLACSFGALLDVNSSLADQLSQGNELTPAIQKAYPQSKIVQAKDVDEASCGVPPNPPGIVEADFNGDGQKDFMVLLRGGVENEIESKGKMYKSIEIKLIAFLKDEHGTYKSSIIYKYDGGLPPFIEFIQLIPPGPITEIYTDVTTKIKNPSVLLIHCEKSSVVFYWDKTKKKFQEIWTGD
jgi:hypothetical protein